ncbi:hypothetical protein Tco_1067469 [Tanacetum coccineum]|uniref:Uncharacterized protein n=1 Tax=Tanacetum coccineum TaxID=301880 RepID=A0ABQ5HEM3_9ASTR
MSGACLVGLEEQEETEEEGQTREGGMVIKHKEGNRREKTLEIKKGDGGKEKNLNPKAKIFGMLYGSVDLMVLWPETWAAGSFVFAIIDIKTQIVMHNSNSLSFEPPNVLVTPPPHPEAVGEYGVSIAVFIA